ncbi:MAG TPA: histidine kinase [Chitinophagaceae bacterium]
MTKHEFIFSDKRSHRLARHVTFWLLWCIAFNLLFHYPNHVFKGWDTSGPGTKNFQELGPAWFFIKTFFVNSLLGVILPQILFTYVLIYWLLPNYYFKKRNLLISGVVTIGVLLITYFAATAFKYSPVIYNDIMNTTPAGYPAYKSMLRVVFVDQLSSLPIITGFALMISLIKRWWQKEKETEQLAKEKVKAELQLLKSQVHPHFLFNTINNIYYFTISGSTEAPEMIKKLSDLLNYILHECDRALVPLEKEIKMIKDYMALEKIRYGEQMNMSVELPDNCSNKMIAPLLLIPFVENSFKHGTSKVLARAFVELIINIEDDTLRFSLINSKPRANETVTTKGNIGLKNVKKRLELLYPNEHVLTIKSEPEVYKIDLEIQLKYLTVPAEGQEENVSTNVYAIA